MIYKQIKLQLSDSQEGALLAGFNQVIGFLEGGGSLNTRALTALKKELSYVISKNDQLVDTLQEIHQGDKFYHVNLCHPNAQILNLPWGIAVDPVCKSPLNEIKQFLLSKNSLLREPDKRELTGGPLKILIMISSPKDSGIKGRLSYEEEERQILHALEPLFKQGEIEIDFTENGSLDALERKIKRNNYHILHFSGHGVFDEEKKEGFLQLEDDISLKAELVKGDDFAKALLKDKHTIALVVLSSCQTAQANLEKGIAGITGTLLQKGIPAVISMGLSIQDKYATSFASHFYTQIANKESLLEAFYDARRMIKREEAQDIIDKRLNMIPMQWLIPNLYLTDNTGIVNWDKPFEHTKPESLNIVYANTVLEKSDLRKEEFIGRREDLSNILPALFDKKPVLLKGQGGIGKTTLARKLLQRLLVKHPKVIPFILNQEGCEGKDFSITTVHEELIRFCFLHDKDKWVDNAERLYADKIIKQITFLLDKIAKEYPIVLFFDNVESFQDVNSKEFIPEHQPTLLVMKYIAEHPDIYMLITGRYPIAELKIKGFDINDVCLNDFIRKCYNLGLKKITQSQLEFLYETIGGNFRMVNFFYQSFAKTPQNIEKAFNDLRVFKKKAKHASKSAIEKMAENLLFNTLWKNTTAQEKELAGLLYHYSLPVTDIAFRVQDYHKSEKTLLSLCDHTLIQVYLDRETGLIYYHMPPLVKALLKDRLRPAPLPLLFHEKAGRYHYYMYSSVEKNDGNELKAAFWHFYHALNKQKADDIGRMISNFYHNRCFYFEALKICRALERLLGENIPFWCGNRMGLIYTKTGQYDAALPYFKSALGSLQAKSILSKDDKENKGTALNNISQIYQARGDYDTALTYLEESLKIRREIGDRAGEGATLNNISGIHDARGDYDTALTYLEESLKIAQEIGDRVGEGATLNNISGIHNARGDYDTALTYLEESLKIRKEIGDRAGQCYSLHNMAMIEYQRENMQGMFSLEAQAYQLAVEIEDAMGLFEIGQVFGQLLIGAGQKEEGIKILRRSYEIGKSGGLPGTEAIKELLAGQGEPV